MEKYKKVKHEIGYGQKEEKAKKGYFFSQDGEFFYTNQALKKGYTKFFPLKEGFFMERFFLSDESFF